MLGLIAANNLGCVLALAEICAKLLASIKALETLHHFVYVDLHNYTQYYGEYELDALSCRRLEMEFSSYGPGRSTTKHGQVHRYVCMHTQILK
jgi:hypothetical protein